MLEKAPRVVKKRENTRNSYSAVIKAKPGFLFQVGRDFENWVPFHRTHARGLEYIKEKAGNRSSVQQK